MDRYTHILSSYFKVFTSPDSQRLTGGKLTVRRTFRQRYKSETLGDILVPMAMLTSQAMMSAIFS